MKPTVMSGHKAEGGRPSALLPFLSYSNEQFQQQRDEALSKSFIDCSIRRRLSQPARCHHDYDFLHVLAALSKLERRQRTCILTDKSTFSALRNPLNGIPLASGLYRPA